MQTSGTLDERERWLELGFESAESRANSIEFVATRRGRAHVEEVRCVFGEAGGGGLVVAQGRNSRVERRGKVGGLEQSIGVRRFVRTALGRLEGENATAVSSSFTKNCARNGGLSDVGVCPEQIDAWDHDGVNVETWRCSESARPSMSSGVCAALTVILNRAVPSGTVGGRIGCTWNPSFARAAAMARVEALDPMMTGMMGE